LPRPAWNSILPFYSSCCTWDDRHVLPHQPFLLRQNFLPRLAWNCDPPISASGIAGRTSTHHCAQLLVEMGSWELFVQAGLEPTILPISASQIARIIGMSHWHLAAPVFFDRIKCSWFWSSLDFEFSD
jgi:hypothetical protein